MLFFHLVGEKFLDVVASIGNDSVFWNCVASKIFDASSGVCID
jgi:hypothetical protein